MEQKILEILLDMQVDIKDLKMKVGNIEKTVKENTNEIKEIREKELPEIREELKEIKEKELPDIRGSIQEIKNNELPTIRKQRLIDSNNIARILNLQTEMNRKLSILIRDQRNGQVAIY